MVVRSEPNNSAVLGWTQDRLFRRSRRQRKQQPREHLIFLMCRLCSRCRSSGFLCAPLVVAVVQAAQTWCSDTAAHVYSCDQSHDVICSRQVGETV